MPAEESAHIERPPLQPIDIEFEPMYSLTSRDYEEIINSLFNLVANLLNQSTDLTHPTTSQQIAERASQIFFGYDEDLGETFSRFACTMTADQS
ncbi:MAG: hypothetical protein KDE20_00270 [Caldilineaceae bacterium]|nr:hypothetical protein [Caldilineaceae bacterium]